MRKVVAILLVFVVVVGLASGCKSSNAGAREFVPGKGWVPVK
ncbi:MAG: hypothetical protein N2487_01325 [Verrucomicrobiae bacterium]|nr:hypothetical protein [Verrucomicrobiae bacterium]